LLNDKGIYLAVLDAAVGVGINKNTAIDDILLGNNKDITAVYLYNNFESTRNELRKQHGDTIILYRATSNQKKKPTTNWATTKEFAKQFGSNVISRKIPISNIIAANALGSGMYHELVIGEPPIIDKNIKKDVSPEPPESAVPTKKGYRHFTVKVDGKDVDVLYDEGKGIAKSGEHSHFEFHSDITSDTGYQSHFVHNQHIKDAGSPEAYAAEAAKQLAEKLKPKTRAKKKPAGKKKSDSDTLSSSQPDETYNAGATYQPLYQMSATEGFEPPDSGTIKVSGRKIKIPTVDKPQRREGIRVSLINIIGTRLYEGKIRGNSKLGHYRRNNSEVRVKSYG